MGLPSQKNGQVLHSSKQSNPRDMTAEKIKDIMRSCIQGRSQEPVVSRRRLPIGDIPTLAGQGSQKVEKPRKVAQPSRPDPTSLRFW